MTKINNQAVVQKLIDELGLYPGVDSIPTELAEKILPVFQINSQDVNVTVENKVISLVDETVGNDKIITVPEDKIYSLLYGKVRILTTGTAGARNLTMEIKNESGDIVWSEVINSAGIESSVNLLVYLTRGVRKATTAAAAIMWATIPHDVKLTDGMSFRVYDTNNTAVLDTFSVYMTAEEFNQE